VSVHPSARGFAHAADAYERARPNYPAEAVDRLCEALRIGPASTVADLAAGTGKLTRLLVPRAGLVVAIEPIAEMAAKLCKIVPAADVREGTAEEMPLPAASVDAVTVAQAFHWFDAERAMAEIHRVLRPHGHLGLMWNHWDMSDPLQAALDDLVKRHRYETPNERVQRWRAAFAATSLFTRLHQQDFRMVQELDADGLVDRIGSTSFVAALPDEERLPFLDEVRALAPPDGRVLLRYRTGVYTCQAL
jgi:ubiquinone/menaquinone biosynthesis C-methylase UbiE